MIEAIRQGIKAVRYCPRFESLQHASRVIGDWIGFYNHRRRHRVLAMRIPAEAFTIAA